MKLEATDVEKAFAQPVLGGVSLTVDVGELCAVVGPNGVGKTTLMRILAGLLAPDAGSVLLDAEDVATMPRRLVAQRVAVVPQTRPTTFDFDAMEFVLMGLHARTSRFSLPSKSERERARAALAEMEVEHLADRFVTGLSGGELQRVVIARAAVAEAPIWLLDEPTASLDVKHRLAVLERVRRHCEEDGCAVAVLHDLDLVHRFADRVVILHDADVVADGAPEDVLTEKLLSRVFEVEMRRVEDGGDVLWIARR